MDQLKNMWSPVGGALGGTWDRVGGAWDAVWDYQRNGDRVSVRWNTFLWMIVTLLILALTWFALGAAAWVTAIMCFQRSGTFVDHLLGFLVAILTGPLFWIFYFVRSGYCR